MNVFGMFVIWYVDALCVCFIFCLVCF